MDRPILFSGPMVRALLDGRKTQTRRIIKPQPVARPGMNCERLVFVSRSGKWSLDQAVESPFEWFNCPYGAIGDRLWVREGHHFASSGACIYRANWREDAKDRGFDNIPADDSAIRWRPSIHMPRANSRITLEITEVRVERLQDISEADAQAEGVEPPTAEREDHDWSICPSCGGTGLHGALGEHLGYTEVDCGDCDTHAKRYRHLWNHINGARAWDTNPWVWVVGFTVRRENIDAARAA